MVKLRPDQGPVKSRLVRKLIQVSAKSANSSKFLDKCNSPKKNLSRSKSLAEKDSQGEIDAIFFVTKGPTRLLTCSSFSFQDFKI